MLVSSWLAYLFLPSPGDVEFPLRRLVGLFDERVEDDDPPPDSRALEDSRDSFPSSRSQFGKPLPHRAGMRHAELMSEFFEKFGQPRIRCPYPGGERLDFQPHILIVIVDRPHRDANITSLLCASKEIRAKSAIPAQPERTWIRGMKIPSYNFLGAWPFSLLVLTWRAQSTPPFGKTAFRRNNESSILPAASIYN